MLSPKEQSCDIWYWDIIIFRNLADGSTTRITTTDIRINLGLPERDFLPGALSSRLPERQEDGLNYVDYSGYATKHRNHNQEWQNQQDRIFQNADTVHGLSRRP